MKRYMLWGAIASLLFLFTACGGSDGENNPPSTDQTLIWDEGNWDEKKWQ